MTTRYWVGIDEAGYGPNLGPLVMTAIVADGPARPRVWDELSGTVGRAGPRDGRLAIDDSKKVYQSGHGRGALAAGVICFLDALGVPEPVDLLGLYDRLSVADDAAKELLFWMDEGLAPLVVGAGDRAMVEGHRGARPFAGCGWRFVEGRSVVVGPPGMNAGLDRYDSKAAVQFEMFVELVRAIRAGIGGGACVSILADKHGGRHYYYEHLIEAFPDAWIERGPEGPERSRYRVRDAGGELEIEFRPKADDECGLVALASMTSKLLRELWMEVFNRFWCGRVADLKPTAGYPTDAARFRRAIDASAAALGLSVDSWWRRR
jgi:hypothetical protein